MAVPLVRSTPIEHASFFRRGAAYFGMSGPAECIAAASLFALMIVFRIVNMLHYRFDSDEPQHLHVTSEIDRKRRATKAGNRTPPNALAKVKLVVPSRVETLIIAEARNTKASG
jgi:hypothetical protein